MTVDPKSLSMLRDYIGTDLARLYNEIDKLSFILGPGAMITPEAIERNIGISKDYNNFEFLDAIINRNAAKSMAIVQYFTANPKNNPVILTVTMLFNFFANLLIYHYTRDKSTAGYMDALGFKTSGNCATMRQPRATTVCARLSKSSRLCANVTVAARVSVRVRIPTTCSKTSPSAYSHPQA